MTHDRAGLDGFAFVQQSIHASFLVPQRRQIDLQARGIQRTANQPIQIDRLLISGKRLFLARLAVQRVSIFGFLVPLSSRAASTAIKFPF